MPERFPTKLRVAPKQSEGWPLTSIVSILTLPISFILPLLNSPSQMSDSVLIEFSVIELPECNAK